MQCQPGWHSNTATQNRDGWKRDTRFQHSKKWSCQCGSFLDSVQKHGVSDTPVCRKFMYASVTFLVTNNLSASLKSCFECNSKKRKHKINKAKDEFEWYCYLFIFSQKMSIDIVIISLSWILIPMISSSDNLIPWQPYNKPVRTIWRKDKHFPLTECLLHVSVLIP